MKKILLFCFYSIFLVHASYAEIYVTPEDSIFENVAIIDVDNARTLIREKLLNEGVSENLSIKIKGYEKGIQLKAKHESYKAEIVNFSANKKSRRFKSTLSFNSGSYNELVMVNGSFEEIISIPVLRFKLSYDDAITESDIDYMDIAKNKLRRDTIRDANYLIGKALKHSMREMRPIRRRDIIKKNLILRSGIVNILYETQFIKLKSLGIAMDSGGKGDIIRVRNNDSNKIVQAVIKSENLVVVSSETL